MKCPKCQGALTSSSIQELTGIVGFQLRWKCIAHTCPHCSTVLSVQIDPVALKTDTVDAVVKEVSHTLSGLENEIQALRQELRRKG